MACKMINIATYFRGKVDKSEENPMKRSSRVWKKRRKMRWKWRKKRMRREKRMRRQKQ
jgi:large subunit ribosomal protein L41e